MRWDTARWAAFLAITTLAAACGGADDSEPMEDLPEEAPSEADAGTAAPGAASGDPIQQGQQIFAGNGLCFTCHGSDGTGTALGPNLTDGDWIWVDTSAGDVQTQITTIVRTGVSAPEEYPSPMPAMGGGQLSDDQLEAVSAYVYSLNPRG